MTPMTLTRKIKQCKLALLWIKEKKNYDFPTCVKLEVGRSLIRIRIWIWIKMESGKCLKFIQKKTKIISLVLLENSHSEHRDPDPILFENISSGSGWKHCWSASLVLVYLICRCSFFINWKVHWWIMDKKILICTGSIGLYSNYCHSVRSCLHKFRAYKKIVLGILYEIKYSKL